MLFASSFGEGFFWAMCFLSFGIWSMARMAKKLDTTGEVQDAAKKGVIGMIGRWLK